MQSKLRLDLEQLSVESFDTVSAQKPRGTVFGEQCTCYTNCTCPGCPTCDASCNGTCDASCNGTCGDTCNGCETNDYSCYYTDCCVSADASACNGAHCP